MRLHPALSPFPPVFDAQPRPRYDIEIVLGNLTPSTPEHPVHLAWWSPRKSETPWNPHISLAGAGFIGGLIFIPIYGGNKKRTCLEIPLLVRLFCEIILEFP